ncbi:ABC transporter permease [Massilia sp. TS11]|uniref:ABC transporter permease n=1 Tax=Massilia sp. TS11 TaxID=2908003 RepID=UPI001EDBDB82|nr:ABC transporter permease [Massilia sp. TS11]MCG2583622.1 ABC transporter permease [Massilia sp. TS11]
MIPAAMLKGAWSYRGFILGSVRREFQLKYGNAILGASWSVLSPLAMILVYTLIFSQVMQNRLPGAAGPFAYSIYLCAGTLTWGLFSEITGRAQTMFLEQGNLLKKINFPRICLPIIIILNALLNFTIIFGLFLGFLVLTGSFPGWIALAMLPVLLIQVLFAIGLGMILGVLNVFFRDVGQFFQIFVQFWFWFTPIVYPATILPPAVHDLLAYNPMFALTVAYQTIFVKATAPVWSTLLYPAGLALVLCLLGLHLFRKRSGEMVDEL